MYALTWGMGHTTRMAALAKKLIQDGNRLIMAGNEKQIRYYRSLNLSFTEIKTWSPEIAYYRGLPLWFSVVLQMGKFYRMMRADRRLAEKLLNEYSPDMIISDNRYGFYSTKVFSVLITHQLWPLFPIFRKALWRWLENQYNRYFQAVWIPDAHEESKRLSGKLSERRTLKHVCYVGWLSVYSYVEPLDNFHQDFEELWLLSGPESEQWRYFHALWNQKCRAWPIHKKIAVCGTIPLNINHKDIHYFQNLSAPEIKFLLLNVPIIYSRIGYTTLMDASVLGIINKINFSPTPGQYEQEYLFKKLIIDH